MVAAYYSRITLSRLTELLDLPPLTTERTLCKLVTDKTIYARIDRPAGIVTFKQKKNPTAVLNAWTTDIDKMLGLVEKTSHLVSKVSRRDQSVYCHGLADRIRSTLCMKLSRARRSASRREWTMRVENSSEAIQIPSIRCMMMERLISWHWQCVNLY